MKSCFQTLNNALASGNHHTTLLCRNGRDQHASKQAAGGQSGERRKGASEHGSSSSIGRKQGKEPRPMRWVFGSERGESLEGCAKMMCDLGGGRLPPKYLPFAVPSSHSNLSTANSPSRERLHASKITYYNSPPPYSILNLPNFKSQYSSPTIIMPKEKTAKRATKARTEKKKKDPNAPKRGLSAYMFFANEQRENVRDENPGITFGQVGKVLGERWKALNDKQRAPYEAKAAQDKKRYEDEKASYNADAEEEESS